MHASIAFSSVALFVLVCALYRAYKHLKSAERSIPGPFLARFTRLWYFFRVRSGNFHHENIALHKAFGPIVRVGPGLYSISDPDQTVYGIGSKFRKSDWYEGWKHPSPERWTLFPDQDIKRHSETRKKFQNLYSMSSLVSYEKYVDDCIDLFLRKMTTFAQSGESIDMAHWLQCYAFDVMGDITYSERFGFLDHGEDIAGLIAALDRSMVYSTLAGIYAWAHPFCYAIMEKIPGSGAAGRNFLMDFVRQKIAERNGERRAREKQNHMVSATTAAVDDDSPRDFLDKLTDAHDADPTKVTPYHIFMMGLSNIVAGSDTTAVSLSSVLFHLVSYPQALARLRQEIAEYDDEKRAARKGQLLPFKDTRAMPYLQAVIKEALRLHPATGLPMWRVVPEGGAVIAGRQLPAGATVGINSWVAHYNGNVFGPDADVFRPERWLEVDKEKGELSRRMEAYYLPFGLGSRTCLGRHISTLEMSKLIPELIRHFDFELAMPTTEWKTINYWFVKPARFHVRVKFRSQK